MIATVQSVIKQRKQMSRSIIFSVYLNERMSAQGMDTLVLAREMGYRTLVAVTGWCNGSRLPSGYQLHDLATALKADPVELSICWLIAKCPELEGVMRKEVLLPRGCALPVMV